MNMNMMEFTPVISTVEEWVSAYNHVASQIVKDNKKASIWANTNPNFLNSQGDRSQKDNEWQKNKNQKITGMIILIINRVLGITTHIQTKVI